MWCPLAQFDSGRPRVQFEDVVDQLRVGVGRPVGGRRQRGRDSKW